MKNRTHAFGLLLVGTSVLSIAHASAASAQTQVAHSTRFYDIPAQPLGSALNSYAEMTGIDLVAAPEAVNGKRSHAIRGNYSPEDALDELLRGTSLSYHMSSAGSVIVGGGAKLVQVSMLQPGTDPAATVLAQNEPEPQPTADQPAGAATEQAQEIVVTGVRASMERARDIKKNSSGVVDAISAEDIGKFPTTNLAESLQRIPGVSISRVNGEGAQVTVRGFGPGYNLVTLNGRTLAATSIGVVGGDGNADGAQGTSRSFDFNNLASEGVRTLEVYKTGRAAVPSGGIGATINVVTRRPLDSRNGGLTGTIGAKANYDTSVEDCISCGSKITPEVTGLLSWSNPSQTFGISLFGNYAKRHLSTSSTGGNAWNIVPFSTFLGMVTPTATINNAPTDPNTLVGVPNDNRHDFSEVSQERINAAGTIQFRPAESLVITADALFAQNRQSERRSDQGNWFNRPFDVVTFDGNPVIDSAVYLHEVLNPTKDGPGSENQYRATKNRLTDYGLNAAWDLTGNFKLSLDGHISKSESLPDNPLGHTSTLLAVAGYGITSHSIDYSGKYPVMQFEFNDCPSPRYGNCNGTLDTGDIGSQVARSYTSTQSDLLKEARADAAWDLGGGSRFDFGADYRDSNVHSTQVSTYQPLGDWGVGHPGDIDAIAPGQMFEFCLPCSFDNLGHLGATGNALKAYRFEDVTKAWSLLSAAYPAGGLPSVADNRVREKIWSAYGQVTWNGEIADHRAQLVAGVRYERTTSTSTSLQNVPDSIRWDANNDFTVVSSPQVQALTTTNHYENILPSMDFRIDLMQGLVGRLSFSRTIARTDYNNLFSATTVGGPNRPTYVGGVPTGNSGNPNLIPLESDNLDLSLEYYYKPDSYVSAGFFDKNVRNFVGNGITTTSLFGLTDPSSGAAGSRSGMAVAALSSLGLDTNNEDNLFVMTALIDNLGAAAGQALFEQHLVNGVLDNDFADSIFAQYNITGNSADPLYQFSLTQPINNKDAKLWGFEIQGQHFFGNTGFGVAAAYTKVFGNIHFDNAADPNVDQFALIGLSDTLNATLIYEKFGFSSRLTYNWRGKFLNQLNRDNYHNPVYTEPFGQLDFNATYDINRSFSVSFDALNLTESTLRQHIRTYHQLIFEQQLKRRFQLGVRYKFGGGAALPPPPPPVMTPAPPPPATQTCADGTVIEANATCPAAPPPPPPAPAAPERG